MSDGVEKFFRLPLTLDAARDRAEFDIRGEFVYLDRNTTGNISVHLGWSNADPYPLSAQDGLTIPFVKLFITHTAQAGKIANLWYGEDVRILQALSTTALTLSKGATIAAPAAVTVGAASTLILAADTARRRARILNDSAIDMLLLGANGGERYRVGPGEVFEVEGTAAIYGKRAGATDITVYPFEERD